MPQYTIGLDYGTNSVRALLVDVSNGREIASSVFAYPHGEEGIVLDQRDPNLARQHPADYLLGAEKTIKAVLAAGRRKAAVRPQDVIGIGVDTTGSTPLPLDGEGVPLAMDRRLSKDPAALAWLWKDHTAIAEAERITAVAAELRPQYLVKCGGHYSCEWFWAKILHCANVSPRVFEAAATWLELADWIPAVLTGTDHPSRIRRGICGAGHKGLASPAWGGYPDQEFLKSVDPRLVRIGQSLPNELHNISRPAGALCESWAKKLGLPVGITVAVGGIDAHVGAVGCGIAVGAMVKILGTSSCDMMVAPLGGDLADIPGLCGIVPESILPGHFGLEAGQCAVGDIYNWFVNVMRPGGDKLGSHESLTRRASALRPGESGLLGLDWHNGNRTVLADQRLTGLLVGLTLHSTPAEVYRAMIESTAFGARAIVQRFEDYGVKVERIICSGGIAVKNPLVMQIYADVLNRRMAVARSTQSCALGSAIAGAVVAGAYPNFPTAIARMVGKPACTYRPNARNVATYDRLFALYRLLHDAFGVAKTSLDLSAVMKQLLALRNPSR